MFAHTAVRLRAHKAENPSCYCARRGCLWSLSEGPCRQHTDVLIEQHGSTTLFRPRSKAANVWLVACKHGHWSDNALAIEPGYVDDLLDKLEADGLIFTSSQF